MRRNGKIIRQGSLCSDDTPFSVRGLDQAVWFQCIAWHITLAKKRFDTFTCTRLYRIDAECFRRLIFANPSRMGMKATENYTDLPIQRKRLYILINYLKHNFLKMYHMAHMIWVQQISYLNPVYCRSVHSEINTPTSKN